MDLASPELRADLVTRLRRIEGQVRGVQRMLEEDRDCPQVLQQMAAIRSAIHQASLLLARAYVARCLAEPGAGSSDDLLDQLMSTLSRLE